MPDSSAVAAPATLGAPAASRTATRRFRLRGGGNYLYLGPALLFLAVFTYYPIGFSAYLSLFRWNVLTPEKVWVGLENYLHLWGEPVFWLVLRNNLFYALGAIPTTMALGLFLAILVNGKLGRARSLYRVALFYPTMVPMVAAAMLWVWLFNPGIGLVNYYLGFLGVPKVEWLYDRHWALPAIIIMSIWKNFGYFMLIYLAALQGLPAELYEAASLEGAGAWARFATITFPLLGPTSLFVFVVAIISSFQVFDQVFVMTQGGPADQTNVLIFFIYQHAFRFWDLGMGATLTTVFVCLLLALIAVVLRSVGRRVYYEGE
ncbi:MAG TPA: sugar ABC transporter permease [Methylomirabilota bacterium]|jgi:ABC-type sugar transport system permease subunit|nr:sugar ABC transporter permease [Methylomirabilota bacterium]